MGLNGEPVELVEDWGDVLPRSGEGGSSVLHLPDGDSEEDTNAVIEMGGNEGVDQGFCHRVPSQEMVKSGFSDGFEVGLKRQGRVQIADLRRGRRWSSIPCQGGNLQPSGAAL